MGMPADAEQVLAAKLGAVFPHLDERQRRLVAGAEARALGHGGIRVVARAAGMREGTVSRGVAELDSGEEPLGRVRRPGGGRKRAADLDPGLAPALLALVEPDMRGDPMSPLRWTTKSLRVLAGELARGGHRVSADTVADLLHAEGFSLQGNAKVIEGRQSPDRDQQFRYINEQVRACRDAGEPVVSVDAKKKELVGEYRNGGREWRPKGEPVPVRTHDFPDARLGSAIPYGVYDLAANAGWVSVGTDHNTAAFAVESLRRWWQAMGQAAYPQARRLLVTADAGGSNGYRTRAWKAGLAALAAETGLEITVCHFPPGTSRWNAIEHRLFSHISMNWRGRPLASHDVILATIAATTTRTGLRVRAALDAGSYPTGQAVSDAQMAALPITRHDWHGDWNYTLRPGQPAPQPPAAAPPPPAAAPRPGPRDPSRLLHPAITGITPAQCQDLLTRLTAARRAQREALLHARRGGPRTRAPVPARRATLTPQARLLAATLASRFTMPAYAIAPLLGASVTTTATAIRETRQLLAAAPSALRPPPGPPLRSLADLARHAATTSPELARDIEPAC
jgi:Rhodopirellula transposase DDE domain